ncbi:vacuolar protein sorting-associated protein 72 [[Candida] railenensis]|uniref:Vacuolar protein sorting-associated protein 72 n=1 Tax=[Candida] railenensis TaxID=45579 RepID=A0A9P0QNY0_9ASCO|nr:vacuolar protein sorting-associated protein 72 [[Candida] railenensis]
MSDDSLVATRARRANAGSRLKRLIELEEQTIEERQSIVYTEDDENVNLLFQEDENDEEFEDSEEDGEGEGDEDDDEDDGGEERDIEAERGEGGDSDEGEGDDDNGAGPKKRTIEKVDADDVLSDSEISETDSDQSEGEKELDKQEKLKQRKLKKKNKLIPAIKQPRPPASAKKVVKKPKLEFTSESLLNSKRSSSRSAVVESKQALARRLKADEERRALLKPVIRHKEVEMTQEERLAEAVETEKANVISLNEFREQEIVKKETQRQMLMSKRVKLVNVIRMVSEEHFITPFDEITEARRVFEKENLKLKRKPGRKKKNLEEVEQQQPVLRPPGSIDLDLPLVKEEMERERIEGEKRALEEKERREAEEKEKLENGEVDTVSEQQKGEEENSSNVDVENEKKSENLEDEDESKDDGEGEKVEKEEKAEQDGKTNDEVEEKSVETEEGGKTDDADNNGPERVPGSPHETNADADAAANEDNAVAKNDNDNNEKDEGESEPNENKDASTGDHNTNLEDEIKIDAIEVDGKADSKDETSETDPATAVKEEEVAIQDGDKMDIDEDNEIKNEITTDDKESLIDEVHTNDSDIVKTEVDGKGDKGEKRVKFVDDLVDGEKIEVTATPEPEGEPIDDEDDTPVTEEEIFEGPAERVSRNMIYLIDFDDEKEHKLIDSNIKTILFGKQSLLPASRRFKDLKQIAKIGESENPYLTITHRKDELFEPVTNLTENDSLFEELKRLPRFGDFEDIVEEEEVNDEEVTSEIVLKTEAPTSLYLPNGNKKNCLITGTEVKYFDPANGIPYSSVETYRLLKQIEQGNVPWYSFGNDANDGGGAELYLGMREGARHAKGVPEGFDA